MRKRWLAMMSASCVLAGTIEAQSVGNMLKDDFTNAGKDILAVWGAPFNASGKDWATFGGAMGLFAVTMLADDAASDWAIRNDSAGNFKAIEELRRGGFLFTGKYVVPPVAALYITGIILKNQGMRDFVLGCASSWVAQSPPRRALAHAIGRARPDTTKDEPSVIPRDPQIWKLGWNKNWVMRSFPGGHIANVMGCATFWNERFQLGIAEPLLYGVVTAVGVGRMADGAHWLSDQVIGTVLGYAIGNEIARRSLSRSNEAAAMQTSSLIFNRSSEGVTMGMRWTF